MLPATRPDGRIYYPCKTMCKEMHKGCAEVFEALGFHVTCFNAFVDTMDPAECYYKPVTCEAPIAPPRGYIKQQLNGSQPQGHNITVGCQIGFQTDPPIIKQQCDWNGKWEPKFTCERINIAQKQMAITDNSGIVAGISAGAVVFIVFLVIHCCPDCSAMQDEY